MPSSAAVKGIEKLTLAKPSSSCPHVHLQKNNRAAAFVETLVEMEGFGSDIPAGGSGGKVDTGTIMEQVKVQIAVANAQELLQVTLHQ